MNGLGPFKKVCTQLQLFAQGNLNNFEVENFDERTCNKRTSRRIVANKVFVTELACSFSSDNHFKEM